MTHRERILAVLTGDPIDRTPVSIRLNIWHHNAAIEGTLPAQLREMRQEEVEDSLGFARAARRSSQTDFEFRNGETVTELRGPETTTECRLPQGKLTKVIRRTDEMIRQGVAAYTLKHPLETRDDYDVLIAALEEAQVSLDEAGFRKLDADTGERGLPMLIVGACPAHKVMLKLAGYENFYYHQCDFPDRTDALIAAIDEVFRRDLWPALTRSSARLVLHGTHFSSQMTPRPLFEKYFLPYFQDFNALMREHGKLVCWHADADAGQLLQHVLEAGFDCADCLATTPLVDETLEGYFAAWQGKMKCWGGLPSIIFNPDYPRPDYERYVDRIAELVRDRNDFIFGASDNVMPGAEWERLEYLAEATRR